MTTYFLTYRLFPTRCSVWIIPDGDATAACWRVAAVVAACCLEGEGSEGGGKGKEGVNVARV